MPSTAAQISTGQTGAFNFTTTTAGVTFVAIRGTVTRGIRELEQPDAKGNPDFYEARAIRPRLTATVRVKTAQVYPIFGDTFALTLDAGIGSETWLITEVGSEFDAEGLQMCNITCVGTLGDAVTLLDDD